MIFFQVQENSRKKTILQTISIIDGCKGRFLCNKNQLLKFLTVADFACFHLGIDSSFTFYLIVFKIFDDFERQFRKYPVDCNRYAWTCDHGLRLRQIDGQQWTRCYYLLPDGRNKQRFPMLAGRVSTAHGVCKRYPDLFRR